VNHETGLILPVASYAAVCRTRGVPLVVDASQAVGKVPVAVGSLGASAVAFAASKLGGPHGAGAVWIARDRTIWPVLAGGAQERGRRPGTPEVRAAVYAALGALGDTRGVAPLVQGLGDDHEDARLAAGFFGWFQVSLVIVAFVANIAHHADVGGRVPGSEAAVCNSIFQEGLRLPPVRIMRGGEINRDVLDIVLLNSRTPDERLGDLRAQFAANLVGTRAVETLIARYGPE
jgi:hypothetical protein